jgi:hypothetical protein
MSKANDKTPESRQPQTTDAVRHVGPTLESEGEQVYVPAREERVSREELAAESDLHVHKISGNGEQIIEQGKIGSGTEPLHTRLAGDTSSDPHTDLGSENEPEGRREI